MKPIHCLSHFILTLCLLCSLPQKTFAFSLSKLLGASSVKTKEASDTDNYHLDRRNPPSTQEQITNQPLWNFYIGADYLYWKATQEGLSFALTGCRNAPGTTVTSTGTDYSPNFSWNSGFKVGATALWDRYWDVTLRYTWYQSDNNQATCSSPEGNVQEGFILGTLLASTNFQRYSTFASSDWNLHFNVLDAEIGHLFCLSNVFDIRAFAGLKFAYQTQDWNNHFLVKEMFFDSNTKNPGKIASDQSHKTVSTGIRIGGHADWQIMDHVSLFSTLALSALWTNYDVTRKDVYTINEQPPVTVVDVKKNGSSSNTIRAVSEFDLGINAFWQLPKNQSLNLSIAYEMQLWLNHTSYIFIINDYDADLSLQGLNVKVRYGF